MWRLMFDDSWLGMPNELVQTQLNSTRSLKLSMSWTQLNSEVLDCQLNPIFDNLLPTRLNSTQTSGWIGLAGSFGLNSNALYSLFSISKIKSNPNWMALKLWSRAELIHYLFMRKIFMWINLIFWSNRNSKNDLCLIVIFFFLFLQLLEVD